MYSAVSPLSMTAAAVSSLNVWRQPQDLIGAQRAYRRVCPCRRTSVGDAVAGQQVRDLAADVDDRTGRLEAGYATDGHQVAVQPAPDVHVDVIDPDGGLLQAYLVRAGRRRAHGHPLQLLRPAAAGEHEGFSGGGLARGQPHGRRRRCAGTQVIGQGPKTGFINAHPHCLGQFALAAGRGGEGRFPVPERPVAVGHRRQPHGGHVALQRDRRVEDAVSRDVVAVVQYQQLLAQHVAVLQSEGAHAADPIRGLAVLDLAVGDDRMPVPVRVEIAQHGPHPRQRRVDHCGTDHALQAHRCPARARPPVSRRAGRRSAA
ncbi:MAG: hypothetical protein N2688_00315 [Burkholderiaceae bacterium]|nr:hypothetical protein [Burkholderiaceae bacterium]